MARDMKQPVSAKKVLIQITEIVDDTTSSTFTDNPFINFLNDYYGGGVNSFVDLGFDETDTTSAISLSELYGNRLDHIASDFTLTFANIDTEKKYYLGSKDSSGIANGYLAVQDPDIAEVAVTLTGAPTDLEKLFMTELTTSPTGWTRYNSGARPSRFGLIIAVVTNPEDPITADNFSSVHFLNKVIVVDAGELTSEGGGDISRTINFQCDASDHYVDLVDAQNTNAVVNI